MQERKLLSDWLCHAKLALTKGEIRKWAQSKAIRVNGRVVEDPDDFWVLNDDIVSIGKHETHRVVLDISGDLPTTFVHIGAIEVRPAIIADTEMFIDLTEAVSRMITSYRDANRDILLKSGAEAIVSICDILAAGQSEPVDLVTDIFKAKHERGNNGN